MWDRGSPLAITLDLEQCSFLKTADDMPWHGYGQVYFPGAQLTTCLPPFVQQLEHNPISLQTWTAKVWGMGISGDLPPDPPVQSWNSCEESTTELQKKLGFPVCMPKAQQDHWHIQPAQICSLVSCLTLATASSSFIGICKANQWQTDDNLPS